jgi:hypothetical protein
MKALQQSEGHNGGVKVEAGRKTGPQDGAECAENAHKVGCESIKQQGAHRHKKKLAREGPAFWTLFLTN